MCSTRGACLACKAAAVGTRGACLACKAAAVGTRGACLACKAVAVGTVERASLARPRGRQPWREPAGASRGACLACEADLQRVTSSNVSVADRAGSPGSSPIHRKLSSESTRTYRRVEVEITSSVFTTDRTVYASSQLLLQKPARSA
jgi:hypothetical protein